MPSTELFLVRFFASLFEEDKLIIQTKRLQLVPCELSLLSALLRSKQELAAMLHVTIPEGWPHFPEAIPFVYEQFTTGHAKPDWPMYLLFILREEYILVGSGGFKDQPDDAGMVEIGYEIAPPYHKLGLATETAQAMIAYAFSHPQVKAVDAHTLPEMNASARVLQKVGMHLVGTDHAPEIGLVWHWRLPRL